MMLLALNNWGQYFLAVKGTSYGPIPSYHIFILTWKQEPDQFSWKKYEQNILQGWAQSLIINPEI